jgi:hypothetical protein
MGDLEPELQSKPTMASMQEEYSKQKNELNGSSTQHSEEVGKLISYTQPSQLQKRRSMKWFKTDFYIGLEGH